MRACGAILLAGCIWLGAGGCSSPPPEKFVGVSGRVTVGGKPLTSGQLGFIPDEAEGTTYPEYSLGDIQSDGTFALGTNDKGGVRPGRYKVIVWAWAEPIPSAPVFEANGQLKMYRSYVATKYAKKETTDLRIEVIENAPPGTYDFDLSPP